MTVNRRYVGAGAVLVGVLLIFLLWLGQEPDSSTPSADSESKSIVDTGPETERKAGYLIHISDMKIDPATLGSRFLLKGAVSTTQDEPIRGATVTLYTSINAETRELSAPLVIDVTGKNGDFEIQLESELTAWLRIDSPGFASVDEWIVLDTPGIQERFYRLRRVSAAIVGVVRDRTDQPISGVFVGTTFPKIYTSVRTHFVSPQTTRSDTSGRFRLDSLPAGDISLSFLKRGYLPTWESVQVAEEEVHHLEISLQEGRAFPIRVQNLRGQSLTSASIKLDSGMGFPADEQGVVQVLFPPEAAVQEVSLEIRAEGYLSQSISFDPTRPQKTVTLEEGPLLEGRIISESGRPVADAKIAIWSETGSARERLDAIVNPDANGTFSVHLSQQTIRRIDTQGTGIRTSFPDPGTRPRRPDRNSSETRRRRDSGTSRGRARPTCGAVSDLPGGDEFGRPSFAPTPKLREPPGGILYSRPACRRIHDGNPGPRSKQPLTCIPRGSPGDCAKRLSLGGNRHPIVQFPQKLLT